MNITIKNLLELLRTFLILLTFLRVIMMAGVIFISAGWLEMVWLALEWAGFQSQYPVPVPLLGSPEKY